MSYYTKLKTKDENEKKNCGASKLIPTHRKSGITICLILRSMLCREILRHYLASENLTKLTISSSYDRFNRLSFKYSEISFFFEGKALLKPFASAGNTEPFTLR